MVHLLRYVYVLRDMYLDILTWGYRTCTYEDTILDHIDVIWVLEIMNVTLTWGYTI